ncbi:MAG: NAD(P)H-dependent oxidoreductase subunit E [Bacteriovoracaceae bacterium]|nr:NAD(P)H-dependent oxidoreductase subunit E [Bacteriovoracaceae bacterium]
MSFTFNPENLKKYEEFLTRYDDKESALLPVLHLAQEQKGYLPEEVLNYLSQLMQIPLIKIKEVVSFYDMFYTQPTARHIVQVCTNITCSMFGSREMYEKILERYETENMKPTYDGKFFFQKMECLGACSDAPCMRLDHKYHGHLNLEKALTLLRETP